MHRSLFARFYRRTVSVDSSDFSPQQPTQQVRKKRILEEEDEINPAGNRTPHLVPRSDDEDVSPRSSPTSDTLIAEPERKRRRISSFSKSKTVAVKRVAHNKSDLLRMIPNEVLALSLSFLNTAEDRLALSTTCTQFRRMTNSVGMLRGLKLSGDLLTGRLGIIQLTDTPETAMQTLTPFANAGNVEAIYMLGMIKSYCNQSVQGGIRLLKQASAMGFVRSTYALGLIMRDSDKDKASVCLREAASKGYLPALQEILSARDMKNKYGEPDADELRSYLDPICLNRLLGRYYLDCQELRGLNTSHCWNPLCGRWAFKAVSFSNMLTRPLSARRETRTRRATRLVQLRLRAQEANNNNGAGTGGGRANNSSQEEGRPGGRTELSSPFLQRVSRMKMCSRCCRAKYCSKLCQVYDWRSGRHKLECQFL